MPWLLASPSNQKPWYLTTCTTVVLWNGRKSKDIFMFPKINSAFQGLNTSSLWGPYDTGSFYIVTCLYITLILLVYYIILLLFLKACSMCFIVKLLVHCLVGLMLWNLSTKRIHFTQDAVHINSEVSGSCGYTLKCVIFKHILVIDIVRIPCEIILQWMPQACIMIR